MPSSLYGVKQRRQINKSEEDALRAKDFRTGKHLQAYFSTFQLTDYKLYKRYGTRNLQDLTDYHINERKHWPSHHCIPHLINAQFSLASKRTSTSEQIYCLCPITNY